MRPFRVLPLVLLAESVGSAESLRAFLVNRPDVQQALLTQSMGLTWGITLRAYVMQSASRKFDYKLCAIANTETQTPYFSNIGLNTFVNHGPAVGTGDAK
ncbi:hypothetical protein Tco_1024721 [Tanacetum coccineum]